LERQQREPARPTLLDGSPLPDAIWDRLQMPFQLEGEWRAAYAHGQSIPLTEEQAEFIRARGGMVPGAIKPGEQ
jgi:hypothetical protein